MTKSSDDSQNDERIVSATPSIIDQIDYIFYIRHEDSGHWKFLPQNHLDYAYHLVSTTLSKMLSLDSSIQSVLNLDPGECAWRPEPNGPWEKAPIPKGQTYYLRYEAIPNQLSQEKGAMINCWIVCDTVDQAKAITKKKIELQNYKILSLDYCEIQQEESDDNEERLKYFRQAQCDGECYVFYGYERDLTGV